MPLTVYYIANISQIFLKENIKLRGKNERDKLKRYIQKKKCKGSERIETHDRENRL